MKSKSDEIINNIKRAHKIHEQKEGKKIGENYVMIIEFLFYVKCEYL